MLRIDAVGLSDVGRMRTRNEDSFGIEEDLSLYVVADGMGGHGNGDIASRIAVQAVSDFVRENSQEPADAEGDQIGESEMLSEAVREAHRSVLRAADTDRSLFGMGTTLVGMLVVDSEALVAHVGDSRVYRLRDDELERLTSDHSWVNEQVAAGHLSEEQARVHPLKSVVTRALGGESDYEADVQRLDLRSGDRFLICSDGLTTMLTDRDIGEHLTGDGSLEDTCRTLISASNERGGYDNITVVMLSVREQAPTE